LGKTFSPLGGTFSPRGETFSPLGGTFPFGVETFPSEAGPLSLRFRPEAMPARSYG
jgi:hypothetical protein